MFYLWFDKFWGFLERFFRIPRVFTSFKHNRLGVDNLDKLVMIMKNWSTNARSDCPQECHSIDEFLMEEADNIDENDTQLNAAGYFNVNHELM
jgi:hypothetical protein